MNQIDDAAEALEAILDRLHHTERAQKVRHQPLFLWWLWLWLLASADCGLARHVHKKDKNADPAALEKKACPCLVHNAFGVRTMDLLRCDTCSATTGTPAPPTHPLAHAHAPSHTHHRTYTHARIVDCEK
jgi:hypothetical protein